VRVDVKTQEQRWRLAKDLTQYVDIRFPSRLSAQQLLEDPSADKHQMDIRSTAEVAEEGVQEELRLLFFVQPAQETDRHGVGRNSEQISGKDPFGRCGPLIGERNTV
jgi:hypothetical protein